MTKPKYDMEKLKQKVAAKQPLTRDEEMYYMMKAFGYTRKEVLRIFEIVENKNPNIILD